MHDRFLVDSHCHLDRLDLSPFGGKLEKALDLAHHLNVRYFLNVCVHPNTIPQLLGMSADRKDMSISIGLHPTEVVDKEPSVDELVNWASHEKVVAIGETGLDYYHPGDYLKQKERFRRHIQAAKQVDKPLIIHTRHAVEDTLTLLKEEQANTVKGVLHCFTETLEMAQTAIQELGFYISFSGIITFKNAALLRDIARQLPLDRLLIETDSPYLTPEPFRGKKSNQPAYVTQVAAALASLHNLSVEQVAQQTSHNFFQLFKKAKRPF